jgi:hypothetical protein
MSLIVRHKNTGHYLRSHGQWTHHLDSALQFNSGLKLIDYLQRGAFREKPESLEIIIVPGANQQSGGHAAL